MAGVSFEVVANMDQAMTTVKSGVGKISDYVTSLSKNQVDWTDMLTGALDPAAIIGAITTLFSTAVLATGSFQASLQNSSADAASSFGDNLGQATQAAYNLSEQTGISAEDAANTLGGLSAAWGNSATGAVIASDSATLAAAGLGNASDIASQFSQVLKEFGVTDAPTAQIAMQELYTAARNSGMSFSDFMNTMIATGPSLAANKVSIQDAANALSSLSTQSGQTASTATSAFSAIASAISPGNVQAQALLETISPGISKALTAGDIAQALTDLESGFAKGGTSAAIIGQQAGINATDIAAMSNSGKTDLDGLNTKVKALATTEATLGTNLDAPMTQIAQIGVEWQKTKTLFDQVVTPMASDFLAKFVEPTLGGIQNIETAIGDIGDTFNDLIKNKAAGLSGVLAQISGDADAAITKTITSNQNDLLLQTVLSNSNLQNGTGGIGNIGKLLGSVDTNSDTNLMAQLLDALKTGNTSNLTTISQQLNIGTINTKNQSATQIEQALYAALFNTFQATQ